MPDKDVILAKVGIIQRCMHRIRSITNLEVNSLEDFDKQDIFVLNLQRAVQAAIDIAIHIVAEEGLGIPTALKENFLLLEEAGIIDETISKKMQAMVGFRNIAVHDYQGLDINILRSILKNNLKDIEDFYTLILKHFSFI